MNLSISVIIPSYNSAKTIQYTIEGLLSQTGPFLKEIIIADSSDDGETRDVIRKYAESSSIIKLVKTGVRVMPAIGRNRGAESATGDILLFLDSDVIPSSGLISLVVGVFRSGVQAGCGSIELPRFQKRKIVPLAQYYLQVNEYIPAGKMRKKAIPAGCNMFCSASLFRAVGGYHEIRAAEDVLLGLKIAESTDMWFIPEASVAHIFREEWKGYLSNQRLIGRYVAVYRKMHERGLFFLRKPFSYALIPLFCGIKIIRIMPRIIKAGPGHMLAFLPAFPVFFIGLLYWTLGFVDGCSASEDVK